MLIASAPGAQAACAFGRIGIVVRVPRLIQVFNVQCVMCGRAAGQLMNGVFVPNQRVHHPVPGKNGSRCGECGGNLYLEPDESVTPFMATQIAAQRTAAQQQALASNPENLRAA
jgi:hypothetical protein